ncbi:tRNA (adenosine(37)-N6)-dimethylallyltransferase MiaA [Anoxynatronum buryatiense]|uniref:tRNA dimethylallyltransferase n=1 Tax=Anoxynatronum buryatiense TaxID=489973 RepID=A0AA45WUM7_9CLOT|nr:tRNA (adenosine(37)-N6)-dimethylallyltransferase MiaA [Anoxynatronum buryatiense]SMP48224.1 tRNA dimethylallyltransferase [Anoxynatronum buryatiense]
MATSEQRPLVVIITGPTAVGKTHVSILLAHLIRGEIISADSMQIYQHMDIGTAKSSKEEQMGIPHHLINLVSPDQRFTVADFQQIALRKIDEIHQLGAVPIVVGGTGLYLHSLLYQMDFSRVNGASKIRQQLEAVAAQKGSHVLHQRLQTLDPTAAQRIHPHNVKRVVRALEIVMESNEGINDFSSELNRNETYRYLTFVINEDRQALYQRINHRVDMMLKQGLEKEVRHLLDNGFSAKSPALLGVGYKEIIRYFEGEIGYEEAVEMIKRNSRRYAKRQLTWFKKLPEATWLSIDSGEERQTAMHRMADIISHQIRLTMES